MNPVHCKILGTPIPYVGLGGVVVLFIESYTNAAGDTFPTVRDISHTSMRARTQSL